MSTARATTNVSTARSASAAPTPRVHVVRTGTANLASVLAGLARRRVEPIITSDPEDVRTAAALVLPGVGAFAAAMESIRTAGLIAPLRERINSGRPTLAICLGLQVLFESSDESPGTEGLGVARGRITRFDDSVRVPQLGWNHVEPDASCSMLSDGFAYYANSFRAERAPEGWSAGWTDHGGRFVAAIERGSILACQFHPELSGAWGAALIGRWLARSGIVSEEPDAARNVAANRASVTDASAPPPVATSPTLSSPPFRGGLAC